MTEFYDQLDIAFESLTPEEAQRVRETIAVMFQRDVFMMKNGKVICHFDSFGTLQEVEFNYKRWKRRKN